MSASASPSGRADAAPWTCPFCALLCDGFAVDVEAPIWTLSGSDCPRARAGLARCGPGAPAAQASVDGVACDTAAAVAAAAQRFAAAWSALTG